jgi:hypothetical protein
LSSSGSNSNNSNEVCGKLSLSTASKDVHMSPHRQHRNSNYLSLPKNSSSNISKISNNDDDINHHYQIQTNNKLSKSPCPSIRSQKIENQMKISIENLTDDFDIRVDKKNLSSSLSKSCLIYVPTDPWIPNLEMDQTNNNNSNNTSKSMKSKKKGENRMKKLINTKSLSRPDLVDENCRGDDDPWVYDETIKTEKRSATFTKRTSRSFHSETNSGRFLINNKSPNESNKSFPSSTLSYSISQKDPMLSLSPTLGYCIVDESKRSKQQQRNNTQQQQHLNVSNPNLLQPRHSFSSSTMTSKRDDELTLNIRRLSEEINRSSNYTNERHFSTSTANINQNLKTNETMATTEKNSTTNLRDSLLETTC